jgi:hypothetical protein
MKVNFFFFKIIKNAFYILVTNWNQLFELGDPKDFSRKFTKFAIFQGKKTSQFAIFTRHCQILRKKNSENRHI